MKIAMLLFVCTYVFCFRVSGQTDTMRTASITEKANAIVMRMQRELLLTDKQKEKMQEIVLERFMDISGRAEMNANPVERANQKALAKISKILTSDQYQALLTLQAQNKRQKQEYLKSHPDLGYAAEDKELDF